MPTLNRNEKVKRRDCGNMYIRQNAARYRKRCAKGVVSCPDCKYSTYNQQEMKYHMAKKHDTLKFEEVNSLFFLRTRIIKLPLSPTTSEKRTWNKTTETQ